MAAAHDDPSILYAHSANGQGRRHELLAHLERTAELAAAFAEPFGTAELARVSGLLHDLGKASGRFQRYLAASDAGTAVRGEGGDHMGAGAVAALEAGWQLPIPLIQGHHGGLRNRQETVDWVRERSKSADVHMTLESLPEALRRVTVLPAAQRPPTSDLLELELLLRMTFSALVDADSLDTEAHFDPNRAGARARPAPGIPELLVALERAHAEQEATSDLTPMNAARRAIRQQCVAAAAWEPGLYRLAAPTGAGKTLAGMAFALHHAHRHGLRRVVVAVPFTSVTEQTAGVYRMVLGHEAVLEHHSAVDVERSGQLWAALAAENWDTPVVVTTTVQLFESLYSNQRSATRKLHRLARSVIVVDEVQALPVQLLAPIVATLRLLCLRYGCTVVLSTATQPAATGRLPALEEARHLVPDHAVYFDRLRRVDWSPAVERWGAEQVAKELTAERQGLAILNTRRDALRVLHHCPPGTWHLSTLLCGAHRRSILAEVRRRLGVGETCRLVSTQVVEAGVDVDFPVVLRALAPFDSIVQAGGRCNREGRRERGRVVVFELEDSSLPPGAYRIGTGITSAMMAGGPVDFDDPAAATNYFRSLYQQAGDLDDYRVAEAQRDLRYRDVADRFRMIQDATTPVVVPYDAVAAELIERLPPPEGDVVSVGRSRDLLRSLQPYTVALRQRDLATARQNDWVRDALLPVWTGGYDEVHGVGAVLEPDRDHKDEEVSW
jgi:CRISPR-associated endonuclease/helicase Cas3